MQKVKIFIIAACCMVLSGLNVVGCLPTYASERSSSNTTSRQQLTSNTPPLVEHIFFHPVIAYPQRAFIGDRQSQEMFNWFVTVPEFKRVLQSLYDNNFMLVHLDDVYECRTINGKQHIDRHRFALPSGKRPLVISVDDTNYYKYMRMYGTVDKLRLDQNGNVTSESHDLKGNTVLSDDLDIVPILDRFVAQHPDFSYRGAKGTLALTGYDGILGWRTQSSSTNSATERMEARKVVQRLKATGWRFASHSYGHRHHLKMNLERLQRDERKWKREVGSIAGKSNMYIYPYGEGYELGDERLEWLEKQGYTVFSHVGNVTYERRLATKVIQDRRHIDGITLSRQRDLFLDLFDVKHVLDLEGRFPINPVE